MDFEIIDISAEEPPKISTMEKKKKKAQKRIKKNIIKNEIVDKLLKNTDYEKLELDDEIKEVYIKPVINNQQQPTKKEKFKEDEDFKNFKAGLNYDLMEEHQLRPITQEPEEQKEQDEKRKLKKRRERRRR